MGIVCGAVDCEHNGEMNECELKKITLNDCYYHTVNEGLQHFWRCKQYEKSEETKRMFIECIRKDGIKNV